VVDRYLDCANPRCGFARIRCPDYARECLVTFSCKTRHFCPSRRAKRREAWSIWLSRHLLLPVPHRQVVFAVPNIIRPFFRYNRGLLGDLYSLPGDRRDHSPPGDHLHLPEASAGGRSGGTVLIEDIYSSRALLKVLRRQDSAPTRRAREITNGWIVRAVPGPVLRQKDRA